MGVNYDHKIFMIKQVFKIIKIKIVKQLFPKTNDIENRDSNFRIFRAIPVDKKHNLKLNYSKSFSIKGEYPYLREGLEYQVDLKELETNEYGTTYEIVEVLNVDNFRDMSYSAKKDILCTIASERNTTAILEAYPEFICEMLEHGKEYFDVGKIYGVKHAKMASYERQLLSRYKYLAIVQKFKDYKIDFSEAKILCDKFKTVEELERKMQENPYHILINTLKRPFFSQKNSGEIYGVDYDLVLSANALRTDLKGSKIRCEYLIIEILNRNENGTGGFIGGSTRLSTKDLWEYGKNYDIELSKMFKDVVENSNKIYFDKQDGWLSKMSTYTKEVKIAEFIKSLINNNKILDWDYTKFDTLKEGLATDEQKELTKAICENRLIVLEAPSGSGKTSSVSLALQMINHYNGSFTQVVSTGKGAKVLSELTNAPASTIHRLALREGGTNAQFIFVDEYSFLSIDLFDMLIEAIHNKQDCRLILCGNVDQLVSIGLGDVANSLLKCDKIKKVTLSKCFRYNSSGIAKVGEDCRQGKLYLDKRDGDYISYGENNDYRFFRADGTLEQIGVIYQDIIKRYNCNPREVTIISPQNIGDLGTIAINNYIQNIINPVADNEKTITIAKNGNTINFRRKDIVLCTKNTYDALPLSSFQELSRDVNLSKEDFAGEFVEVMNGEIGYVGKVGKDWLELVFGENVVVFTKKECLNLLHAYCVSAHRLQGSTLQHSIVITSNLHKRMLCRELSYVALTRARKSVTEIGDISAINYAIHTRTNNVRETWLSELLNKEVCNND